jgi:DNA-binding CsgD family transcriptional regulator
MLEHLYASVLDAARFEDFATDVRVAMNGSLVALQSDEPTHRHRVQHHYAGSSIDVRPPDYANDASQNLYFVRGAAAFAAEGVIDGMHLFAPGELERTAFYDEILAPLDVHYSMGLCLHADASGNILALTISRDRHRQPFDSGALDLAKRLLPHVRNVLQLQQRLQQLESTASIMDRVSHGVWLLDAFGHVVRANPVAQALLAEHRGGIRQQGRMLAVIWRADGDVLANAVRAACTRFCARRSDFLLHDAAGRAWAACTVHPLQARAFDPWQSTDQAAALLLLHPLAASPATPGHILREVFGLTHAEAELAQLLVQHGSLAGCADKLGKSHETLRTQLKALFAKTETHHQADLIRRLVAAVG